MQYSEEKDIVYAICKKDIQSEAEYFLGRELTEYEMQSAVKMLEYGVGESLMGIMSTIMGEIRQQNLAQ